MLTASIVCPHCSTVELAVFGDLVEFGYREVVDVKTAENQKTFDGRRYSASSVTDVMPKHKRSRAIADDMLPVAGILVCQGCHLPILATLEMTRVEMVNHYKEMHKIGTTSRANTRFTMSELRLFPEPQILSHHSAWPERIQVLVPDIDRLLQQRFDPSIIIASERSVIDLCMKDLGGSGRDIYARINDLLEQGVITKPIADWSHKVRLLGRDATHDAEGTLEEAQELFRFILFFLRAAYELNADINRESEIASAEQPADD